MKAFISHNKSDKNIASEIALYLAAENVSVWFDDWEISAGDSIVEEIENGLIGCTHFIILWSKNSATSKWVRRELRSTLTTAIETGNPKVIPICVDDTALPPLLTDIRSLIYEGGTEKDRDEIISAITGGAPSQNFIKAIVKKYNELIYDPKSKDPFGINACPKCGNQPLARDQITDEKDNAYFVLACKKCTWSNWSQ